jgi:Mg-chelatase subunit ChlD
MGAIIVKADKKSSKLLSELARRLGGSVINLEDNQYEEIALGKAMEAVKTGELVDRNVIVQKLSGK